MPTTWVEPRNADLESWLLAREPTLHRLSSLLAGDPHSGRDLLRPALVRLCLSWQHIGAQDAEDQARALLVSEHRRTWDRAASAAAVIALTDEYDGVPAARALVDSLPARERAVVVVRHHLQLDDVEAARLLHLSSDIVRSVDREVVTALRVHLDRLRREHPERIVPVDPDQLLDQVLHDRAEAIPYLASDPGDLRAEADRIRSRGRRRTALAVVGAVALVALVVRALGLGAAPLATPPTPDTPTPDAVGSLDALPQAGPPDVPYLVDNAYVDSNGVRTELPVEQLGSATPYRGGFLVTDRYAEGTGVLRRIDRDGSVLERVATYAEPVARDRGDALWVTVPRGNPSSSVVHRRSGAQDVGEPAAVVGLLGADIVYNAPATGAVRVTDLTGPPRTLLDVGEALDVEPVRGLVAAVIRGEGAVVVTSTGEVAWRSDRWLPQAFSPDGRLVIAFPTRGLPRVVVLDAGTGEPVFTLAELSAASGQAGVLDAIWEDEKHLLVLAAQFGESTILRAGLDGEVARTVPTLPANEAGDSRYRFATH